MRSNSIGTNVSRRHTSSRVHSKSRVYSFAVLFPDTSRAGPAREQTLVLSRPHARELITF